MEERSRTKNSIINSTTSLITQVLTVIMNFIVKTVFIRVLGSEYLGVNGLFTNIITMLSLADLGIGTAIPYSLYKPLAKKDENKILVLMNFYSKVYNIIGIVVLILGLSLTPFLGFFIKEDVGIPNLSLIYILFVIHSASSYFFVYKRFLIDSDQKGYITSRITFIFSFILSIVQILILIFFKNYILFLLSSIVFVISQNIVISRKTLKLYPFLKKKNNEKLPKDDFDEISRNVMSLVIYKIGSVVTNGTDNIVISKCIGLVEVGIYSNYTLIVNSVNLVLNQLFHAITSSIGNLVVTNNERSRYIYENLNFMNFWIYTVFGTCLIVLINPFINLWIGEEYVLSIEVVLLIGINFYILGMQSITDSFRNAYGLFYIAKFRPIVMVVINIVSSIILVKILGIAGVLIGTLLSRITTTAWLDPFIVYKYGIKDSCRKYFEKYILYFAIFIVIAFAGLKINSLIVISNFFIWIIDAILFFIITNIVLFILFFKSSEFKYFYQRLFLVFKKKIKHFS